MLLERASDNDDSCEDQDSKEALSNPQTESRDGEAATTEDGQTPTTQTNRDTTSCAVANRKSSMPCEESSNKQDEVINPEDKAIHVSDLREALMKEKRKKFAKKWFTKFNMYKRNYENLEISKRGRASSGIGEERIKQMETAYTIASKARGSRRGGLNRK